MNARNTKHVAHIDVPGGGQVWVEGTTLFVGHMKNPNGTSVIDVRDPKRPELLATVPMPEGWHSPKVRVVNGVRILNHARSGPGNADFGGGLGIYDVSTPSKPKQLAKWQPARKRGAPRPMAGPATATPHP